MAALLISVAAISCQSNRATNKNDSVGGLTKADSAMTKRDVNLDSAKRMGDTTGPGTGKSSPAPGTGGQK